MVDTAAVAESEFIKLDTEKESDSEMESEDGETETEVPKKKVPNVVSGSRTAMLEQVPIQTSFHYLSGTVNIWIPNTWILDSVGVWYSNG